MTWIKASERLPEGDRHYKFRFVNSEGKQIGSIFYYRFQPDWGLLEHIEWLDESEAQEDNGLNGS